MKKMLQQYHGKPLTQQGQVIEGIEAIADRFQSLPLSFMTFHGGVKQPRSLFTYMNDYSLLA